VICRVDGTCGQRQYCVRRFLLCLLAFPLWKKCADRGLIKAVWCLQWKRLEIHRPVRAARRKAAKLTDGRMLGNIWLLCCFFEFSSVVRQMPDYSQKTMGSSAFHPAPHQGNPIVMPPFFSGRVLQPTRRNHLWLWLPLKQVSPQEHEHTTSS
jgi:hypothetical protein